MVFNVAVCKSKRNACWDQLVETEAHCLSLLWHEGKVCTRGGLLACFIYPISIFGMQKKQFDLLYIWRYASSSLSEAFLLYNRTLPLLHVPDTTHFYEPGIKRVKLSLQHLEKKKKINSDSTRSYVGEIGKTSPPKYLFWLPVPHDPWIKLPVWEKQHSLS